MRFTFAKKHPLRLEREPLSPKGGEGSPLPKERKSLKMRTLASFPLFSG
jgi:hypothetical protein